MSTFHRAVIISAGILLVATGCVSEGLSFNFGDPGGGSTIIGDNTSNNGGGSTNGGGPSGSVGASGSTAIASQVIALVNDERARAGVAPLTANSLLTAAAAAHAADMASNGFFSHTGSDGSSSAERATRAGYNWSTIGENIAMGATSAEQVMEMWMNSSGHRANILNASFTEIGVGLDSRGGSQWVQVFARPQ